MTTTAASSGVSSPAWAASATAAPSALEVLLSCDYPDVDALGTARAGAGVGTYADELGELADMAAAVQRRADQEEGVLVPVSAGPKWEVLVREVGHMLADARKREFHPCLEAMRDKGARVVAEAAQLRADLTWVPLSLPLELVAVVRDGWDRCCDLRTEHEEAEAVRADAWEGLSPLLQSPVPATIDAAQPLIESDSTEETRRGWNLEWTWKRRAQFNWAVETLLEGLQRRAEYHAELGDRLAALAEHMGLVNTVADRCRDASNAFCLLGAGRPAREYQALVAPLLDRKEAVLNGTREDVAAVQEEREVIFKQDLQHRAYFERVEAAGGLDTIDLRAELEGLHRRIEELGAQKTEAVAKVSEERRVLEGTRQAEIDRALRESKEFLDDNTRRQEACAAQVRAIEEQHERDVEEVRRCIEANKDKGEEALRRHAAEAAARRERESTRGLAMARLRDDAERLLAALREKVAAMETEVAYVREAVTPLCHRLALGTTTHQREHLLELYEASEHPPEQLAKCLAPAFTYRALLCSSLVRCCDDIDNVVDSSRTHLAFCKETDDPKGLMMADVMRDLAEQKQAMLLQATETRLNMATDIQCWQKIGRIAGELWYLIHPRPFKDGANTSSVCLIDFIK